MSNSISSRIILSPKSLKKLPDLYSIPHLVRSILILAVAKKFMPLTLTFASKVIGCVIPFIVKFAIIE